ncbi:thioredoxin reductase (NADPH) [Mycoplasmopsis mustelae]|uniref:Thioredoxin reductase (NADPH) n=2 Tax=Mycoplasmopsis mustelae TaxID=171289 RepID=A0A4R7UDU9_9BACT|nr:FAD-dependent oxidoreductase [Mycoplasmopsis mustelae]TDV24091.1 thioredoxin reductase (NADPH) [Mycoplasmopsis mustelae]
MTKERYDLIIIGGGPAALNAALYASRAELKTMFVEKGSPGGKLVLTNKVENWIGTEIVDGWKLATEFFEHAKKFGAKYKYGEVVSLINHGDLDKEIVLANGESLFAKTVLIATGMKNREPKFIKNFDQFLNRGVSYCAICDGPLFKGHPTLVLGAGNSAVEEGTYLANIASEVHIVIRDADFSAEKRLVKELLSRPNVIVYRNSQIKEINGTDSLESAIIVDKDGNETKIAIASFFPYIGMLPTTTFIKDLDILDSRGFIEVDASMQTRAKGIFAAGDICAKEIRQIVTAASDGAIAAKKISDLINFEE